MYSGLSRDEYLEGYFEQHPELVEDYEADEADPGELGGDAESALASVGWGTNEDYGYADEVL